MSDGRCFAGRPRRATRATQRARLVCHRQDDAEPHGGQPWGTRAASARRKEARYRAAKRDAGARRAATAHRSVTMSSTAPNVVHWLNLRAKRPSCAARRDARQSARRAAASSQRRRRARTTPRAHQLIADEGGEIERERRLLVGERVSECTRNSSDAGVACACRVSAARRDALHACRASCPPGCEGSCRIGARSCLARRMPPATQRHLGLFRAARSRRARGLRRHSRRRELTSCRRALQRRGGKRAHQSGWERKCRHCRGARRSQSRRTPSWRPWPRP